MDLKKRLIQLAWKLHGESPSASSMHSPSKPRSTRHRSKVVLDPATQRELDSIPVSRSNSAVKDLDPVDEEIGGWTCTTSTTGSTCSLADHSPIRSSCLTRRKSTPRTFPRWSTQMSRTELHRLRSTNRCCDHCRSQRRDRSHCVWTAPRPSSNILFAVIIDSPSRKCECDCRSVEGEAAICDRCEGRGRLVV